MPKKAIQIDVKDNVATTTTEVNIGELIDVINPEGLIILKPRATEDIPFGHKLAITQIKKGDKIIKYGEVIGIATNQINEGSWANTHNVGSARMPTKGKEEGIL